MTFQEFMKKYDSSFYTVYLPALWYKDEDKSFQGCYIEWTTGGLTGGSCWGTEANEAVTGEIEPEFEDLDKILENICPSISFLQYKDVCREIIKTYEGQHNEYYGNYRTYCIKYFSAEDLYNVLNQKGLL